ncbi:unnamed protein product [Urochloa decumbens]|uniref:Uncharacterized protein n=1 Tax=Urochloa decumbens TaxID=240449 RepID=A0ABC9D267_9POAL
MEDRAEGGAAVVKTPRSDTDKDKDDGPSGTKAEQVRMGRQEQNGVLILLQSAWMLMSGRQAAPMPARAIPLYRSCCRTSSF